jgi:hypothetical protein
VFSSSAVSLVDIHRQYSRAEEQGRCPDFLRKLMVLLNEVATATSSCSPTPLVYDAVMILS